jgi:hypothetical protein
MNQSTDHRGTIWWAALIIAALLLFISNPNEKALHDRLRDDGWFPMKTDRVDILVLSFNEITGFTGRKAVYLGVGGQYFQISGP